MTPHASEIRASGLFDAAFYVAAHPDIRAAVDLDALEHFCQAGWVERRQPNPWFDTDWYLRTYTDVSAAKLDPLLHYVRHGEAEGRRPSPHFDPAWYAGAFGTNQTGALKHFLLNRAAGKVFPAPEFYAVSRTIRDQTDPFLVYLANPPEAAFATDPDAAVIAGSGLFDPNHYLLNGNDVMVAGLDAILHFCRHGWREGRQPSPYFDPAWYRATNPEVARLGINPLAHYILDGEASGRRPVVFFDPGWYRSAYSVPSGQLALGHFLVNRRGQTVSPNALFDLAWYVERHGLRPNRDPFAHYLRASSGRDVDPSPDFDAVAYRRRFLGRRSRHFQHLLDPVGVIPLLHALHTAYVASGETWSGAR